MKFASLVFAISMAATLAVAPDGFALAQTNDNSTPVTGMKPDRVTAPRALREAMQKREAMKRRKRADCRAQAKAEKVPLMKRPAYVKRCTTQSS